MTSRDIRPVMAICERHSIWKKEPNVRFLAQACLLLHIKMSKEGGAVLPGGSYLSRRTR